MHTPPQTNNCSYNKPQPFAEVIQSSLEQITAQSWNWDQPPSFGSLVTIGTKSRTIFGLVYQIQTNSIDPGRQPFAYQKTHEELQAEQPQLFEMLKTTFDCLIVGYQERSSQVFYLVAPQPPLIHSFISPASQELTKRFFSQTAYLHLLFRQNNANINLEDLLLALLQNQHKQGILTTEKLEAFIETFSLLTGNDYRRLKLFLQRVEPICKNIC